jgi:hypothetical protein
MDCSTKGPRKTRYELCTRDVFLISEMYLQDLLKKTRSTLANPMPSVNDFFHNSDINHAERERGPPNGKETHGENGIRNAACANFPGAQHLLSMFRKSSLHANSK